MTGLYWNICYSVSTTHHHHHQERQTFIIKVYVELTSKRYHGWLSNILIVIVACVNINGGCVFFWLPFHPIEYAVHGIFYFRTKPRYFLQSALKAVFFLFVYFFSLFFSLFFLWIWNLSVLTYVYWITKKCGESFCFHFSLK